MEPNKESDTNTDTDIDIEMKIDKDKDEKEGKEIALTLIPFSRDCKESDIEQIRKLYNASFPREERKPFEMILLGIEQGLMKGLMAKDRDNSLVGLAFEILPEHKQDAIILDYLAIVPEYRGQGFGSKLLQRLIKEQEQTLIVEIESTRTGSRQAIRRKGFYLQNGLRENGIEIELFGVAMELLSTKPIDFSTYFRLQKDYLQKSRLPYVTDIQKHIKVVEE